MERLDRTRGALGHRAELFRCPGPASGGRRGHAAPDRRGAVRTRQCARRPSTPAPQPEPAYQGDGRRGWVLAVQLYGVRSRAQLGPRRFHRSRRAAGDRRRARRRRDRAQSAARAVLRPAGCSGSPYSPNSRLFLNPLYIDVEAVEEFDRRPSLVRRDRAAARRRAGRLCRRRARSRSRRCARRIGISRERQRGAPRRFRRLPRRARPRAANASPRSKRLRQNIPAPWREWPEQWRTPSDDALRRVARQPSPTRSASTNSCNGTPSASSSAAARSRGGAGCRSGSTSTPRSASIRPAPTPGWTRARCCAGCRSARRPTSSIPPARTGG